MHVEIIKDISDLSCEEDDYLAAEGGRTAVIERRYEQTVQPGGLLSERSYPSQAAEG